MVRRILVILGICFAPIARTWRILAGPSALGKWRDSQKNPNRTASGRDLPIGKFVLYRIRFIFAGELAGERIDFGGLTAQTDNIPHVIEVAIADHPGIDIAYDYRVRQII